MSKIFLNTRFYKFYNENNIFELRVIGFINEKTCKCIVTKGPESELNKQIKIPIETLQNEYTRLSFDGIVTFNTVTIVSGLRDVMVTVLPKKDIDLGINLPSVVCRQSVLDLFAKQFSANHVDYTGLSISRETCPADVEFDNFLSCTSIDYSVVLSYYIGDKLDYILSLFKHDKFDNVLHELFVDHCRNINRDKPGLGDYFLRKGEANGYVQKLNDLLKLNNFEYDLYRAFNIIPTTLSNDDFTDGVLSKKAESVLSDFLRTKIYKSLVLKYDKDIDLNAIKKKYCLVSDNSGVVYVVAYLVEGNYYTELDDNDEENIEKLTTLFGTSKSMQHAYESIKFNKDKYRK